MNLEAFRAAVASGVPPAAAPPLLMALWHDARGDWHAAHAIVQDEAGNDAAWLHAYLHRKEGDLGNAGYWYRRAGRAPATVSLEEEWCTLAAAFTTAPG